MINYFIVYMLLMCTLTLGNQSLYSAATNPEIQEEELTRIIDINIALQDELVDYEPPSCCKCLIRLFAKLSIIRGINLRIPNDDLYYQLCFDSEHARTVANGTIRAIENEKKRIEDYEVTKRREAISREITRTNIPIVLSDIIAQYTEPERTALHEQ